MYDSQLSIPECTVQMIKLRHDTNLQIKEHPDSKTLEDNEYNNI